MKSLESITTTLLALVSVVLLMGSLAGCPKSYPDCDDDSTCRPKSEYCVDGRCQLCRTNKHCAKLDACMICDANECVRPNGCCKSALDCPNGKCWKDPSNPSAPGTCGGNCQTDSHCPEGQRCSGGGCVPKVSCTDDSLCPAGQKCISGQCRAEACELQPVYFDFNEFAVRLDMESIVANNASCVVGRDEPFRVEGHCDERGSDEFNLALGQRRAAAVVRQYRALGVDGRNMAVISYGEERPTCNQAREDCWRQNRRVETVPR